jgi:hypothetical protein
MKREPKNEDDVKALVKEWFKNLAGWSYAPVQNGLGVHGIHDRVGCIPIIVTPEMVGRRIGLFVSIEAKAPGRRNEPRRGMSAHQQNNMEEILDAAGLSICCDGVEDLNCLSADLHALTGVVPPIMLGGKRG